MDEDAMLLPGEGPAADGDRYRSRQAIAARIRASRIAGGLTQQQLAGDTYSKSYISALERGKMTPSMQALITLAERLEQPVAYLLGEQESFSGPPIIQGDLPSFTPERKRLAREGIALLRLCQAEGLIRQRDPERALDQLGSTDEVEALSVMQRPRWYWLHGWAWLLKRAPAVALPSLEKGLRLLEALSDYPPLAHQGELVVMGARLRCFLGLAYDEMGQSALALDYYRRALALCQEKQILDLDLQLRVYGGLASVYLQLGCSERALEFYAQAIEQANEAERLASLVVPSEPLGLAERTSGDRLPASTPLQRTLIVFELHEQRRLAASLRALFGQVLLALGRYEEAEVSLRRSLASVERHGEHTLRAILLVPLAALYHAQGHHARAMATAREGLALVKVNQDTRTAGGLLLTLAVACAASRDDQAAEHAFREATGTLERAGEVPLFERARHEYSAFLATQGRFEEAYQLLTQTRIVAPLPGRIRS